MAASTPLNKYQAHYRNFFRDFPNFSIVRTNHALDKMREHFVQLPQIRTVLKTGALVRVEPDIQTGLDKYRVSGHDADGRRLEVVANLHETGSGRVVIITIIEPSDAGGGGRRRSMKRGGERPSEGELEVRAPEAEGCSVSGPP